MNITTLLEMRQRPLAPGTPGLPPTRISVSLYDPQAVTCLPDH